MKEDFSELIQYLDGKFNNVDQKFGTIDRKFEIVDQKLIELDEDIKDVKEKMVIKEDFQDLQTSVDAYAQKADTYFQEMVMLTHKVDRHEKWLHQVAEKLGIKLEY